MHSREFAESQWFQLFYIFACIVTLVSPEDFTTVFLQMFSQSICPWGRTVTVVWEWNKSVTNGLSVYLEMTVAMPRVRAEQDLMKRRWKAERKEILALGWLGFEIWAAHLVFEMTGSPEVRGKDGEKVSSEGEPLKAQQSMETLSCNCLYAAIREAEEITFSKTIPFFATSLSPQSNQLGERPESPRVKFYHRVSLENQWAEAFHMAEGSRGHLVAFIVCLFVWLLWLFLFVYSFCMTKGFGWLVEEGFY